MLSLNGSLSISFDAVVYDNKTTEIMVSSYLYSREGQQSPAEKLKNVKVPKNLHRSKKIVNLSNMERTSPKQMSGGRTFNKNVILNAQNKRLEFSLECAFDFRLSLQSKVRIAEELIRKVKVTSIKWIVLMLSLNGSLSTV